MILFNEKEIEIEDYDKELDNLVSILRKKNNYDFDYIIAGKQILKDTKRYNFKLVESMTCILDYFEDMNIVDIHNDDVRLIAKADGKTNIFLIRRLDKRYNKGRLNILNKMLKKGDINNFSRQFDNISIKLGKNF